MNWSLKGDYREKRPSSSTFYILLVVSSVVALFFAGKAGLQLHTYLRHSLAAPATIERWEVVRLGSDTYVLDATYSYTVDGESHTASSRLSKYLFLNELSALEASQRLQDLHAYVEPRHPDRALLERHFPLKSLLYATLVLGVLLYFFFLVALLRRKAL